MLTGLQILGLSLRPSQAYLSVPTTIYPTDSVSVSVSSPDSPYFSVTESLSASLSLFASPSLCFSTSTSPCLSVSLSFYLYLPVSVSVYVCELFSVSLSLFLSVFLIHVLYFNPIGSSTIIVFANIYNPRFLNVESTDIHTDSQTPETECNVLPINIFSREKFIAFNKIPKGVLIIQTKKTFKPM